MRASTQARLLCGKLQVLKVMVRCMLHPIKNCTPVCMLNLYVFNSFDFISILSLSLSPIISYLFVCLSIHPSILPFLYPSSRLSIHPSIYLSICCNVAYHLHMFLSPPMQLHFLDHRSTIQRRPHAPGRRAHTPHGAERSRLAPRGGIGWKLC